MNRRRAGAAAWAATSVLIPVQLLVAWQWPDGYSITDNAISDLGVTTCGLFSEGGQQIRNVCSPWYPLFGVGMVVCGVLTALGAALLYGQWQGRSGRGGVVLMGLGGLLVAAVGFAPWDTRPEMHDIAAVGQAVAQWAAMCLLAVAAGSGLFRRLTLAAVVVSMTGFVAFLMAGDGAEVPGLGFGLAERLSFDTLTLWTVLVGVTLRFTKGVAAPSPGSSIKTTLRGRLRRLGTETYCVFSSSLVSSAGVKASRSNAS